MTKLHKFSRTGGKEPKLALQRWQAPIYQVKIIALLIDDPEIMTVEQAEMQVEQQQGGYLAHVFHACDATLARTPVVVELVDKWIKSTFDSGGTQLCCAGVTRASTSSEQCTTTHGPIRAA